MSGNPAAFAFARKRAIASFVFSNDPKLSPNLVSS